MKAIRLLVFIFLAVTLPQMSFSAESTFLDEENLIREETTVAIKIAEIKKSEATHILNETRQLALQGKITSAEAIKIIKEQNDIITQIEDALAAKLKQSVEEIRAADEQKGYLGSFISGAQDLAVGAIAPFKSGYGYTQEQKEIARKVIDGLIEQRMQLAKDYEEELKKIPVRKAEVPNSEYSILTQHYEKIIAELNDDIHEQQVITGDAMSAQRELFWKAVAAGAVVAGIVAGTYFLMPGKEITPEVAKELENAVAGEPSVPKVSQNEPIDVLSKKPSLAQVIESGSMFNENRTVQPEQIIQKKEQGLQTNEPEITTPEEIAGLLRKSDEDRAQQAEREAHEEELLNKQIQWQDELWWYQDATDRAFAKFAQEHTPPANVQKLIEENKEKIIEYYNYLPLKGEDDSYVAVGKGDDITRIYNADAAREFIENNGLTSLEVPKKWIYNVDGYDKLFAEYIQGERITAKNPLNLKEAQDLVTFIEKTGYGDFWDNSNIIRDSRTGKLAFIDVEDDSFRYKASITGLISRLTSVMKMDSEAQQWLDNYLEKLKENPQALTGYLPQRVKWLEDYEHWKNSPDRSKNNRGDEQVDYYLPPADAERIKHKVNKANRERWIEAFEKKKD